MRKRFEPRRKNGRVDVHTLSGDRQVGYTPRLDAYRNHIGAMSAGKAVMVYSAYTLVWRGAYMIYQGLIDEAAFFIEVSIYYTTSLVF